MTCNGPRWRACCNAATLAGGCCINAGMAAIRLSALIVWQQAHHHLTAVLVAVAEAAPVPAPAAAAAASRALPPLELELRVETSLVGTGVSSCPTWERACERTALHDTCLVHAAMTASCVQLFGRSSATISSNVLRGSSVFRGSSGSSSGGSGSSSGSSGPWQRQQPWQLNVRKCTYAC